MKFCFAILACLVSVIPSMAFDLEKVNGSLTRAASDDLFSKDYEYKVLADLSVRRTWTEGNRAVNLEYDVASDKLIGAEVKYDGVAPVSMAIRDAESIAGKDLPVSAWKTAKTSQAKAIGLSDCRYVRLEDGSYLFIELPEKGKASSLSYFSKQPKNNRRILGEAERVYKTGFGVNPDATAASSLYQDEETRKAGTASSISMSSHSSSGASSSSGTKAFGTPRITVNVTTSSSGTKGGSGKSISWSSKNPVNKGDVKEAAANPQRQAPVAPLEEEGAWHKSLSPVEWGGIALLFIIGLGLVFNSVSSSSRAEKQLAEKKKRDALVRQQRVKIAASQGKGLRR